MSFNRADYISEPSNLQFELKRLFKQEDPLVIFEIGACEGEDSVKYSRLFPASKIYAFEPLPDNIPLIEKNFSQYNIRNASCYNLALSNQNGQADFYVSSGRPEGVKESDWDFGNKSSSLLTPEKHLEAAPFIKFKKKIVVQTATLQSFCRQHNITEIDFIHMDVQGAELMVLEGAGSYISSIKAIWLEVSKVDFYKNQPLVEDVQKFMEKNNFVLVKDAVHGIQGDQLYVSKNHFSPGKLSYLNGLFSASTFLTRVLHKLKIKK